MPPVLSVKAGQNETVGTFDIEGGVITPAFDVKYLRFGIWHHFEYQEPASCLRAYCESIGLDYRTDIIKRIVLPDEKIIDLEVGKDIGSSLTRTKRIDVVVSYKRRGITHRFGFETTGGDTWWLERYLKMIGIKMTDVKIKVLKDPVRV